MKSKFKKLSWEEFYARCKPNSKQTHSCQILYSKNYLFFHQYHEGLDRDFTELSSRIGLTAEEQYDNLKINYKNYLELDYIY